MGILPGAEIWTPGVFFRNWIVKVSLLIRDVEEIEWRETKIASSYRNGEGLGLEAETGKAIFISWERKRGIAHSFDVLGK